MTASTQISTRKPRCKNGVHRYMGRYGNHLVHRWNGGARSRIRINLPVGTRTEHQAENTSEKAQEG